MTSKRMLIWDVMDEILDALRTDGIVIVKAPTGSGKTTQVPQAVLDAGLARSGRILVVQPRRVACRAAARYVAEDRNTEIGGEVGYIVRYDNQATAETKLCFVTDGVLMRFLERDVHLSWADVVVFDEFHERRLFMDVALGMLREARKRRSSLKIVVMSATLEIPRLELYLGARMIEARGTSYPVEVRNYDRFPPQLAVPRRAADVVAREVRKGLDGNVLVFLPGKEEIREAQRRLEKRKFPAVEIIPLHGDLFPKEQDRIFAPTWRRKVILATNIAETSLTIPGITLVVDCGLERRNTVDSETGMSVLSLTRISRASAEQRAGRAGRTARGRCIRLWSEGQHDDLEGFTPPEIQRLDLGNVILTMKSVGLDARSFDFLDPPPINRIADSERLLRTIGALEDDGSLTQTGWRMLRLPLPPRYARMVVEAERSRCLNEVASVACLMAGRPIFRRPPDEVSQADAAHKSFATNDASDFFTLLEVYWRFKFRYARPHWAHEHYLNFEALHDARLLRRKVLKTAFRRGTKWNSQPADFRIVARAIATGFPDRVVRRTEDGRYRLSDGRIADVAPWSVVTSELAVAGEVRLHVFREKERCVVGFLTAVSEELLAQIAPGAVIPQERRFTHRPFSPLDRFGHLVEVAKRLTKGS